MGLFGSSVRSGLRASGALCTLAASVFAVSGTAHADILCQQVSKRAGAIKVYYGVTECPRHFIALGPALVSIAGGLQGPEGPIGPAGATGPAGPAGPQGPKGDTGSVGPAGPAGATGPAGPAGPTGAKGATGATGVQGLQGPQGPNGAQGPQGTPGIAGPAGPAGATGPAGPAGAKGATGATGVTGATGSQGPAGANGATGPAGPAGPQGPQGIQGPVGPLAQTAYPGRSPIEFDLGQGCKSFKQEIEDYCGDENGCTIYERSMNVTSGTSLSGQVRTTVARLYFAPKPGDVNANSLYVTLLRDSGNEYPDKLQVNSISTAVDKELLRHTVNNDGTGGVVNQIIHYYNGRCAGEGWTTGVYDRDRLYSLSFNVGAGWLTHVSIHDE